VDKETLILLSGLIEESCCNRAAGSAGVLAAIALVN